MLLQNINYINTLFEWILYDSFLPWFKISWSTTRNIFRDRMISVYDTRIKRKTKFFPFITQFKELDCLSDRINHDIHGVLSLKNVVFFLPIFFGIKYSNFNETERALKYNSLRIYKQHTRYQWSSITSLFQVHICHFQTLWSINIPILSSCKFKLNFLHKLKIKNLRKV